MSDCTRHAEAALGRHPPADPYPIYERLLSESPLVWSEATDRWAVLGYAAAREVLRDDSYLADDVFRRVLPRLASGTGHDFAALRQLHDCITFFLDPPAHGPARRLLTRMLANWPAAALRPLTEAIVSDQLGKARQQGGFDLVLDFARPIPGLVIGSILNLPGEDIPELARHSESFIELFDVLLPMRDYRRIDGAARTLIDYFAALVRQRRRIPGEDGVSFMIRLADNGSEFGDADLAGFCAFMFFACQETTASFLAGGAALLLQNTAAMEELRRDPAKLPCAADDLLRHHSPVQAVGRVASRDWFLAGKTIAAGDRLAVFLGAANRDPSVYPARSCPVFERNAPPHLAFGDGRHFCLGAPMARIEGVAAFAGLVEVPRLWPALDKAVWAERRNFRALASLPVLL